MRKIAKASRKRAKETIKMVTKAVKHAIRAIIKAATTLANISMAGLSIVVFIIIIVTMIGAIVSSVYGIFYSGQYDLYMSKDGMAQANTLNEAIFSLNKEYQDKIQQIQNDVQHNTYDIEGQQAEWKDILALYTVVSSGGDDQIADSRVFSEKKNEILKDIFWKMNYISYTTDSKSHEQLQIGLTDTKVVTITETSLHIKIQNKSIDDIMGLYNLNEKQQKQLAELRSERYTKVWNELLYTGSGKGDTKIVQVAAKYIGNQGGEIFWRWYGFEDRVAWCACFVSYVANECGYIQAGIIPKFAACQDGGIKWFKERQLWKDRNGYVPKTGDIIFFDWEDKQTKKRDGNSDHVGIVEEVKDGKVYTIEGNTSDSCARRNYDINSLDIMGYGTPKY